MRKSANRPGQSMLAQMRAAQAEGFTLFPIWREILADCETPVSAYRKLARMPYTFLLESVEGGERLARYSFIGIMPEKALRVRGAVAEWHYLQGPRTGEIEEVPCDDPLVLIEAELARDRVAPVAVPGSPGASLPRLIGGAVGYLGYEMVAHFERIPVPERDPLGLPDAVQIFTDTVLIFDHVTHRARIVTHARLVGDVAETLAAAEARIDEIEQVLAETPLAHTAFRLPESPANRPTALRRQPPKRAPRKTPARKTNAHTTWRTSPRHKKRSWRAMRFKSCFPAAPPAQPMPIPSISTARCGG